MGAEHSSNSCSILQADWRRYDFRESCRDFANAQTIENLVFEFAVESSILTRDAFENAGVIFSSFDKADAAKGKLGSCVKLASTFDERCKSDIYPDGEVIVATLDADKSGDTSQDVADSVHHSFKKMLLEKAVLWGITTDSGGGGTIESVARCLKKCELLVPSALVGNCSLHNLNLELAVPMKKYLFAPSLSQEKQKTTTKEIARNVEQLLYCAFAWEKEVGFNVIKEFWDSATTHCTHVEFDDDYDGADNDDVEDVLTMFGSYESGEAYVAVKRGSVTRWWSIGEAADTLLQTLPMRRFMVKNLDDMTSSGKAKEIARDFLSLSKEPTLICDLALIKCFHRSYLAKHTKFLQSKDTFTKKAGFQAMSVFVRCFLMQEDYKEMISSWRTMTQFKELRNTLNRIPASGRAIQNQKIQKFFEAAFAENQKMFKRWICFEDLGFLAAFSEAETGSIVSRHILGIPEPIGQAACWFESKNHDRRNHLGRFSGFVGSLLHGDLLLKARRHFHIVRNTLLLQAIADGANLWDQDNVAMKHYRVYVLKNYGAFFSNTQGAERANKDQNLCAYNNRGEQNVSKRLIATSQIKEVCEVVVLGNEKKRVRGRKKIERNIERVEAVHREIESIKKQLGHNAFIQLKKKLATRLEDTWQSTRVSNAKQMFEAAIHVTHIASAKELCEGVDVSPLLEGKLQYRKIHNKSHNLSLLRNELKKRKAASWTTEELGSISTMGIKDVKSSIKEDETAREGGNPKYNDRFFKVLHTPIDEYEYNVV